MTGDEIAFAETLHCGSEEAVPLVLFFIRLARKGYLENIGDFLNQQTNNLFASLHQFNDHGECFPPDGFKVYYDNQEKRIYLEDAREVNTWNHFMYDKPESGPSPEWKEYIEEIDKHEGFTPDFSEDRFFDQFYKEYGIEFVYENGHCYLEET